MWLGGVWSRPLRRQPGVPCWSHTGLTAGEKYGTWPALVLCKSRKYIACLLHCDVLFAKGVAQICHCQKPLYYTRLWDGKSNGVLEQDAQPLQDLCQLELDAELDELRVQFRLVACCKKCSLDQGWL